MKRLIVLFLCALLAPLSARGADSGDADPADRDMGRRLQEALRAQNGEIHRCYGEVLAREPGRSGELLVRLVLGERAKVTQVDILKDLVGSPALVACLSRKMSAWRLPQLNAAPGDEVVFPLVFRDVPGDAEGEGEGEVAALGVTIQHEVDAARSQDAASGVSGLSYLSGAVAVRTVAPGRTWTLDAAETAGAPTLVYVLSGQARLRGANPSGDLKAGDGLQVAAGAAAQTLQSVGVAPLKVVRLRSTQSTTTTPPVRTQVLKAAAQPWLILPSGQVRILADAVTLGAAPPASLEVLDFPAGEEVPSHRHEASEERIYMVSGGVVMNVGEGAARREVPVAAGDVVSIPAGVPHGLRVLGRISAVQSYAPAGPEGRFRLDRDRVPVQQGKP